MDVIGAGGISVYGFFVTEKYADEWRDLWYEAVKRRIRGCKTDPAPLTTVDVRSLDSGHHNHKIHNTHPCRLPPLEMTPGTDVPTPAAYAPKKVPDAPGTSRPHVKVNLST